MSPETEAKKGRKQVSKVPAIMRFPFMSCPGCHESIILGLVCEVLEEMELEGRTVLVPGGGCTAFWGWGIDVDVLANMHGPGICLAQALKRVNPETFVLCVQGDGELGAIGPGFLINAVLRGANITVVALNNANYGSTGGQMAPTTPIGMRTSTTPLGRDIEYHGRPMKVAELVAFLDGSAFSARVSVHTPGERQRAKKALQIAYEKQIDKKGFSYVEFISACPPNWHVTPPDSLKFIEETMLPVFPLGTFKNI